MKLQREWQNLKGEMNFEPSCSLPPMLDISLVGFG
jgi:hypothetical protein